MDLKEIYRRTKNGDRCELTIRLEPEGSRTVVVSSGSFRLQGVEHTLAEDEGFDVPVQPRGATLLIYLVREKSTGAVRVFFDLDPVGGLKPPYVFRPDGPLEDLYLLAAVTVPSGAGSLAAAACRWLTMGNRMEVPNVATSEVSTTPEDVARGELLLARARAVVSQAGDPTAGSEVERHRRARFVEESKARRAEGK